MDLARADLTATKERELTDPNHGEATAANLVRADQTATKERELTELNPGEATAATLAKADPTATKEKEPTDLNHGEAQFQLLATTLEKKERELKFLPKGKEVVLEKEDPHLSLSLHIQDT